MTAAIYLITSKSNPTKQYVGSAVCPRQRWQTHIRELVNEKHSNIHLQRHVWRYGINDLEFSILKKCFPEELLKWEQHFIDTLQPSFNICKTAGSKLGTRHSPDTRIRMKTMARKHYLLRKRSVHNSRFL